MLTDLGLSILSNDRKSNKKAKGYAQNEEVNVKIFNDQFTDSNRMHFVCHHTKKTVISVFENSIVSRCIFEIFQEDESGWPVRHLKNKQLTVINEL